MDTIAIPGAIFRPARAADADAVRTLTRTVYAKYVPLMGREPLTMSADEAAAIRDHQVWVLEVDGELVASLELIPEDGCLVVENVAVSEAFQGQGIGRWLMAFADSEARRQGFTRLRLYTNETMTENIAMYERFGYLITRREAHLGTDIVHMHKVLERNRSRS